MDDNRGCDKYVVADAAKFGLFSIYCKSLKFVNITFTKSVGPSIHKSCS